MGPGARAPVSLSCAYFLLTFSACQLHKAVAEKGFGKNDCRFCSSVLSESDLVLLVFSDFARCFLEAAP